MTLFRIIGLLVGAYALYAALRGEEPANFWLTVAIHGGLAVALETVF
jgi:hypothetical protein